MAMTQAKAQHLVAHPRAFELLYKSLPQMQPSALKHEYLPSVANVLNNPVATIEDKKHDATSVIGFGNKERTLPLVLSIEHRPDQSIRHAFTPNIEDPLERRLIAALQKDEQNFAATFGIEPRDIMNEFNTIHKIEKAKRRSPREFINTQGIAPYQPRVDFRDPKFDEYTRNFYETKHLPTQISVNHSGKPNMDPTSKRSDYLTIADNLAEGLYIADPAARIDQVDVNWIQPTDAVHKDTLKLKDIEIDGQPDKPRRPGPPKVTHPRWMEHLYQEIQGRNTNSPKFDGPTP